MTASSKKAALYLTSTLRQMRDPVIDIEYKICGWSGTFVRAEVIKKYGAATTLAKLRRISALGCDRLVDIAGDRCATRFPGLAAVRTNTAN